MNQAHAVAALLLVLLAQMGSVRGMFKVEKGGLKITFPPDAKAKYPTGFDMALSE